MRTLPVDGPEHGARVGGFASSPAPTSAGVKPAAGGGALRRTWQRAMARGALAGLVLEATVLVPAALLLPGLRLPWGLMLGASLALPVMLAVYPLLLELDAAREGTPVRGRENAAEAPVELPWSLGLSLYGLIAVAGLAIGAGAAALAAAGGAGSSRVAAAMALAAALGPGAAGAGLLRRVHRASSGRMLLNAAATVGIAAFLLAMQWAALWIVMFDSGWTP